jgi:hypothetical protein
MSEARTGQERLSEVVIRDDAALAITRQQTFNKGQP